METKTDPKLWATVTIAVATLGCLGLLGSALISILPDILKSTPIPNIATPTLISTEVSQLQENIQLSPTPSHVEKYQMLSLEPYSELSAPETNLGLPPGEFLASDIPFSVGWKTTTQCSHIPERPQSVAIETNLPNPQYAYLLLQASWGLSKYRDKKIGEIVFHFSDNSSIVNSLTLGYNIRDWSRDNDPSVITLIFSPDVTPAWEGSAPDGRLGGIDMLTVRIPEDKSNLTLSSIEVLDLSASVISDIDPCIEIIAATVKYAE